MTGFRGWLSRVNRATQMDRDEAAAALAARWAELPSSAQNPAQVLGRKSTGCEATHGVFPKCDFACAPCYHSSDANKVRVDGPHTIDHVGQQMAHLRKRRGPAAYAQLIGGEVSLLDPADHSAALQAMWDNGRIPMSFSHGDFDYEYLRKVSVAADGTPRFTSISWALHIDTTMKGRNGAPKPTTEAELNPIRRQAIERFERLQRDHGVRSYLAHNMTVTPANLGQVAETVDACAQMGYRMFSFQPAAYVGNENRWQEGFRAVTDDAVWEAISAGVGRALPWKVLQFGDTRCNRVCWGAFVGDQYVPILEDDDEHDAAVRDEYFSTFGGSLLGLPRWLIVARVLRTVASHPSVLVTTAGWFRRAVRRAGGIGAIGRPIRPVTFVMHSFIDARDVAPAWEALSRGEMSENPAILAAQERLQACAYTMSHPDRDELIPACVQHSVLDPGENQVLVELLPLRPNRDRDRDRDRTRVEPVSSR